jgi:hypothetical protein
MGFMRHDESAMRDELTRARAQAGIEDPILASESDTDAFVGRLQKARELSRSATESARRYNLKEDAKLWEALSALRETEFGNLDIARQRLSTSPIPSQNWGVQVFTALALARAGKPLARNLLQTPGQRKIPQTRCCRSIGFRSSARLSSSIVATHRKSSTL